MQLTRLAERGTPRIDCSIDRLFFFLSSVPTKPTDSKCGKPEQSRMPIAPHTTLKIAGTLWIVFLHKDSRGTGTSWGTFLAPALRQLRAKRKIPAPRLRTSLSKTLKDAHLAERDAQLCNCASHSVHGLPVVLPRSKGLRHSLRICTHDI